MRSHARRRAERLGEALRRVERIGQRLAPSAASAPSRPPSRCCWRSRRRTAQPRTVTSSEMASRLRVTHSRSRIAASRRERSRRTSCRPPWCRHSAGRSRSAARRDQPRRRTSERSGSRAVASARQSPSVLESRIGTPCTWASRDSRPRYSSASAARCSPRSHSCARRRADVGGQALGPDVEIAHVRRRDERVLAPMRQPRARDPDEIDGQQARRAPARRPRSGRAPTRRASAKSPASHATTPGVRRAMAATASSAAS